MTNSLGSPRRSDQKTILPRRLSGMPLGRTVAVGVGERRAIGTSKGKGVGTGVKVAVTKLGGVGVKVPMVRAAMVG